MASVSQPSWDAIADAANPALAAQLSLVAADFGVTIMPESIRVLRRLGLAFRPIKGSPTSELLLTWRTNDTSPALREFLAFVRTIGVREMREELARGAGRDR